MGVSTHTLADLTSPIVPARFFQAFCIHNDTFMPKALPEFVKTVDHVQGEAGAVGCTRQFNFSDGAPFKYAKSKVNEIDAEKFYCKYTTFEGDVLGNTLECAVYESKFEPSGNGTHYTMLAHFHNKGDNVVPDEQIAFAKESVKKMFNTAEEYLTANPQLYA